MTITLDDIRRRPADFVRRIQAGETVLITDDEQTLAELKPVKRKPTRRSAANGLRDHFFVTARPEEWEKAMDELAASGGKLPSLPDDVFDRETLYEDRL